MGGALLESTLSASSFRASVWPQGSLAMVLTSEGNQGNYFSQQMRTVSRVECRETYSLSRNWMGVHNLKFDMTLGGTAEHGLIQGHPINTVDSTGAPLEGIRFAPGQPIQRPDIESAFFAQDHWVVGPHLAIEYGVRAEQQEITETFRIGLLRRTGLDPLRGGHTVVRAGVGVFYDRVPLNVYGFASYPNQIRTFYGPDGTVLSGPTRSRAPRHHSSTANNKLGTSLPTVSTGIFKWSRFCSRRCEFGPTISRAAPTASSY